MYWIILILGVALWCGAHAFKRVAPARRAEMGDKAKGMVAVGIVLSIILMVIGYRGADVVDVWYPPSFMVHINNLLVLIALYMMSPAPKRGKLLQGMRHPMQTGFGLWAGAHLLVNGDLASIILFGGLLAWTIVTAQVINRAQPEWTRNTGGSYAKDGMFLVGSVILLGVIGFIHSWLGVWPFPL